MRGKAVSLAARALPSRAAVPRVRRDTAVACVAATEPLRRVCARRASCVEVAGGPEEKPRTGGPGLYVLLLPLRDYVDLRGGVSRAGAVSSEGGDIDTVGAFWPCCPEAEGRGTFGQGERERRPVGSGARDIVACGVHTDARDEGAGKPVRDADPKAAGAADGGVCASRKHRERKDRD